VGAGADSPTRLACEAGEARLAQNNIRLCDSLEAQTFCKGNKNKAENEAHKKTPHKIEVLCGEV
jgi:hypothetical protein